MSKDSIARCCQTKKIFKKSRVKGIKIFLKKKKATNENIVENDIRISQKMQKLVKHRKTYYEMRKNKNWLQTKTS